MSSRKIDNPRKWAHDSYEAIRARRDLSDEGKLAHIGKVYRDGLEAFKAQAKQDAEEREAGLRSKLRPLVAPKQGHTPEWRKLRDEALDIKDPDTAMRRLDTALTTGDTLEAHAIGAAALDRAMSNMPGTEKWVQVVNQWGASDKYIDDALTELSEFRATQPSTGQRMLAASFPMPSELSKNSGWEKSLPLAEAGDGSDLTPRAQKNAHDMNVIFRNSAATPEIGDGDF